MKYESICKKHGMKGTLLGYFGPATLCTAFAYATKGEIIAPSDALTVGYMASIFGFIGGILAEGVSDMSLHRNKVEKYKGGKIKRASQLSAYTAIGLLAAAIAWPASGAEENDADNAEQNNVKHSI